MEPLEIKNSTDETALVAIEMASWGTLKLLVWEFIRANNIVATCLFQQ